MADVPWDKEQALDTIAAACIAGDFAAVRLGWLRLTEASTNASYARFAAQLVPVLLELRTMREGRELDVAARMEAAASIEHNLGLVLAVAEEEQAELGQHDARLGLAEMAVIELARSLKSVRARVKALEHKA